MRDVPRRRLGPPEMVEAAVAVTAEPPPLVVAPGAFVLANGLCSCLAGDCPVPGLHPWNGESWWSELTSTPADIRALWEATSPQAGIVVPTGSVFDAVEVPLVSGRIALARLRHAGVRLGPVIASEQRWWFLVASGARHAPAQDSASDAGAVLADSGGRAQVRGPGGFVVWPPSGRGTAAEVWFAVDPVGPDWPVGLPAVSELFAVLAEHGVPMAR